MSYEPLMEVPHTDIDFDVDLSHYTYICSLVYYEGDFLALYADKDDNWYFVYWCDCDDNSNRWQLIRTTPEIVDDYINKEISLYKALSMVDDYVIIFATQVDTKETSPLFNVKYQIYGKTLKKNLPDDYMPNIHSKYKFAPCFINKDYELIKDKQGIHIVKKYEKTTDKEESQTIETEV